MTASKFTTDLLGKPSHESLIKLQDQELKFLEVIRKTLNDRIKCERDYSRALLQVATIGARPDVPDHNSPLFDAWQTIVRNISSLGQSVKRSADLLQSETMDKVATLIKDKQTLRKSYVETRTKIDSQLTQIMLHELDEKKNCYIKQEQIVSKAKKEMDQNLSKGKGKDAERSGDKLKRSTMQLHHAHNSYVLQVMEASNHQYYYRNQILPELISNLSYMEVECAQTVKDIMIEFTDLVSPCKEEIISEHNAMRSTINTLDPDCEYTSFIEMKSSPLESEAVIIFDVANLQRGEASDLPEGAIELNKLTLQSIENQKTSLEEDILVVSERLKESDDTLLTLHGDINQIHDNMEHIRLMQKKLEYVNKKMLHTEDSVLKEKLKAQLTLLQDKQNQVGNQIPQGVKLPSFDTISQTSESGKVRSSSSSLFAGMKKGLSTLTGEMRKIIQDKYKLFDVTRPVHEHEWYHGEIPRLEAIELLKNEGDFLLRKNGKGDYVVSSKNKGKHKHFIIQQTPEGDYKFESNSQTTVVGLIEHHHEKKIPVTRNSDCVLSNPVPKDKWQLSHDDVEFCGELGKGNFGDVYRATLKPKNIEVAVKTCRDTVDSRTKDKFLMEARILKGYDHPNIVKLIGVCTDKQPIYIVMELVSGGDLNKYLKNLNMSSISQKQLTKMCHDACSGLKYLEERKCIHRDVAARNCLITTSQVVKITDFGMSREEEDGVYNVSGSMKQIPIKWTAPEALNFGTYTSASDVWSFGVLSWEIFSFGKIPYPNMTNMQSRAAVDRGDRMEKPTHCSNLFYNNVMLKCWQNIPEDRPKFAELFKTIKSL